MQPELSSSPTIYLKDYTPPPYYAEKIDLCFQLFEDKTCVKSTTYFKRNQNAVSYDLILNGEHQKLLSVEKNGVSFSEYTLTDKTLVIEAPEDEFSLTIISELNPEINTELEGLYKSQGTYCTQCEAEGFRRITYFQDRPDVLTIFSVRIEADKALYPVLLSNGNLMDSGDLEGERHFTSWHDPFPKPCYLFALVAGDLVRIEDQFITQSKRTVDLHIYVRYGDQTQCGHAMLSLKKAMKWDEEVYGREYELDLFNIVVVSDFNTGAMENTSLNIFNTSVVLSHPETATDQDFMRVEAFISHEYFHNWTGNRVTCRDWFQLSLKEGLTIYRDHEFCADMNSKAVQRIDDINYLRRHQFAEDSSPLAHPVQPDHFIEINNFYTATVYEKGSEIIRMQHLLLGTEKYRKATDLYFERYDGHAVTCNDFVQCIADVSGRDMDQFFLWYKHAGTPNVDVKTDYNEDTHIYKMTLEQFIPEVRGELSRKPMHIPVLVGLLNKKGEDICPSQLLEMTEATQTFTFENIASCPTPSILRGFSAPVKLTTDLSEGDLRFLQIYDTDEFNRWDSGYKLTLRAIEGLMKNKDRDVSGFISDFGVLLKQGIEGKIDKALLARMLTLPSVALISQTQEGQIDPLAIYKAREKLLLTLKETHQGILEELYNNTVSKELEFSVSSKSIGQRALRNSVLDILSSNHSAESLSRAKLHYENAKTMTDRVAALTALSSTNTSEREDILNDFYNRFKEYPLVIDKWFSLQAMGCRDEIFDDLEKLRNHSEFNIKNPNRVRALYSSFVMNNPVKFHDPTGKGYEFLGDEIIELNEINPQIGARQLSAFQEWKRYTPDRQKKMQMTLQKILDTKNLTSDIFELASKILKS